jgi:hypothetical protein
MTIQFNWAEEMASRLNVLAPEPNVIKLFRLQFTNFRNELERFGPWQAFPA